MQSPPTIDPLTNNAIYNHPIRVCSLLGIGFPCSCALCRQQYVRKIEERGEKEFFMKQAAMSRKKKGGVGVDDSL